MTALGASRQAILDVLREGSVESPSGSATTALGSKAQYGGTLAGLSALLKSMEAEGLIEREIRGRRCYSIRLGPFADADPSQDPAPAPTLTPVGIDYSELASRLLDQVVEAAGAPKRLRSDLADAQARLAATLEENQRFRIKIASLGEELAAKRVEVDGLRASLRRTEANLSQALKARPAVIDPVRQRELDELARQMTEPPQPR